MKKILFLIVGLVIIFSPVLVFTQYGLNETAGAAKLDKVTDIPKFVGTIAGTALSLVGVIFFALMIYAGFLWMTAQGKEEQAKKALDTIIACIIGLIIILAAYAITRFIFTSAGVGGTVNDPTTTNCPVVTTGSCKDTKIGGSCTPLDNGSAGPGLCALNAGGDKCECK